MSDSIPRLLNGLTGLTLVATLASAASAEVVDVYLLAGQSNAGGHGYVDQAHSTFGGGTPQNNLVGLGQTQYLNPQQGVQYFFRRGANPSNAAPVLYDVQTDGFTASQADAPHYNVNAGNPAQLGSLFDGTNDGVNNPDGIHPFGPELTFGQRIRELNPDRPVAIIKYSQGATDLVNDWNPTPGRSYDIATRADAGHSYAGFIQTVNLGLQKLTAAGDTPRIRGMLWLQGENDAGLSSADYATRLAGFIKAVREDVDTPNMPFAIGQLYENNRAFDSIRDAQMQVAQADPFSVFIPSTGLGADSTFGGTLHFNTAAQLEFGRRYADGLAPLSVPEPAGASLVIGTGLLLARRRRAAA